MQRLTASSIIDPLEFYRTSDFQLHSLLRWVAVEAGMLRRSKQLPILGTPVSDFKPMGVAATQKNVGHSADPKEWFLIHWPSVVQNIDIAFEQGHYSIVALLWHFREVLFRRSVAYHDLLRRKIAQHLTYRYFPLTEEEKAKRGYIDLSAAEEEIFKGLAAGVVSTPKTMTSLRASFKDTLVPHGTGGKIREELFPRKITLGHLLSDLGGVDANECSVFSFQGLSRVWRQLPCERSIRRVRGPGFGPSVLADDFRELFYAFHVRRVDLGVARLSSAVLAVNLYKYIPYRAPLTPYYKNLAGPKVYGDLAKTSKAAREFFETVYEPLIVHGAAPLHRQRVELLWGDSVIDHVLFLSSKAIGRRLSKANRMEVVRNSKTSKTNLPTGAKVPRLFIMSSPPIPELGVDELRFELIRRPAGVYWGVPWEMPPWTHYEISTAQGLNMDQPVQDLPRKDAMRKGVTFVESYDRYFYSLDMLIELKELPDNPVRKSRVLREWMRHLANMPARQFQLMQAGVRKDLVVQQKRKPGRSLRGITWTREEDAAICQYYRPKMPVEAEAKLLRICRGRTLRAISRRASEVRAEMIQKGIYDLRLLPHRHYNAKLGKLVQDAKDKAAAMVAEN